MRQGLSAKGSHYHLLLPIPTTLRTLSHYSHSRNWELRRHCIPYLYFKSFLGSQGSLRSCLRASPHVSRGFDGQSKSNTVHVVSRTLMPRRRSSSTCGFVTLPSIHCGIKCKLRVCTNRSRGNFNHRRCIGVQNVPLAFPGRGAIEP